MKIAYFCEPQFGGTYTFFKRIRPELAVRGIDFRCIPPLSKEHFPGTPFAHEEGVEYLTFPENDPITASRALIEHLDREHYDAVMILPGSDVLCNNLVRYMPRSIRALACVPMITRGAYAPTRALAPHLDVIYAVSDRVKDDLVHRYGVEAGQIQVVYNGAVLHEPDMRPKVTGMQEPFRLLYAGRLSDLDKGVMLLPGILDRVLRAGVCIELTVAGSGPDEGRLRSSFAQRGLSERVHMLGSLSLERVEQLLNETDCFLLPSRFEGCPNALLEAMAAGCACVAARIRGSVDQIIVDGQSGILATVADETAFADAVIKLARDPDTRGRIGAAARARILDRFTMAHTAEGYANAMFSLRTRPDHRPPPESLQDYTVPSAMQPTWRTRIPAPLKNAVRKWLERFGISS